MSKVLTLLSNNGYIMYNKQLAKNLGIYEAIYIGELCSEYTYWKTKNILNDDMFYSTQENIEENTQLSPHQQKTALKHLKELGIVQVIKKGLPAKNYYKINEDILLTYVVDTPLTSELKIDPLESQNLTDINNNKETKINTNIISEDIISQNSSNFSLKGDDDMLFSGIPDVKKEKEKKKEKKKEKRTYVSTIENYTDNPKLREWLLKFVDKQNKYFMIEKNHPFSIVSLDAMLEKLDGNKTDEDKIDVILSCLENDYHGVYVKSDKKYYKKQSTLSRIESEEIHSNSFDEGDMLRQEKFKEEMSKLGKQTTF